MALPKLLQKLFTNGGAGDKLNQDIIPDIPYSKVTDAPVVDSALSPTSTNAVQNKVINSALDGKLSLSGGNVNGDITFRTWGAGIGGSIATGDWYGFNAGTSWELLYNDGACLWLCGNGVGGHNTIGINGEFVLSTGRGTIDYYTLRGKPDGSLTWGGKNVLTGNSAGLTVVSEYYSANSWYRKYSDGWIEQGGIFYYSTYTSKNNRVTLAIPFSTAVYGFAIGGPASATGSYDEGGDSGRTYYATVSFAGVNKTQVLFSEWQEHYNANASLSIPVVAWGK